jgi:hypothetical protein
MLLLMFVLLFRGFWIESERHVLLGGERMGVYCPQILLFSPRSA